jgi:DNA-binding Xre family transcriptional regulator
VGYLESGQRWSSLGTVARLASALGCSAVWLAYGLGAPQEAGSVDIAGLGSRLASLRTESGLTKADLVEATGLSSAAILGIERGAEARIDTVERIAKALGVSPGWLGYGIGPMVLPPRRRTRSAPAAAIP